MDKTLKEVKQDLKDIKSLDDLINSYLRQLDDEQGRLTTIKAIAYDEEKLSPTNSISNPTENTVIRIMELKEEINKMIDKLIDKKVEVRSMIDELPPEEQVVMLLRYFEYMTWEEVAVRCRYTTRHVQRIHGEGLYKLALKKMALNVS